MLFRRIATLAVASGVVLLGTAGVAAATDDDTVDTTPAVTASVTPDAEFCGFVDYVIDNPTAADVTVAYDVVGEGTSFPITVPAGGKVSNSFSFPEGYAGGTATIEFTLDGAVLASADVNTTCAPTPPEEADAGFDVTSDCDTSSYTVNLHNPTAEPVTFTVDSIVNGETTSTDYVVPAGETVDQKVTVAEDTKTDLVVRIGDRILDCVTVTLDCAAEPTDATPTDSNTGGDQGDEGDQTTPPATTPAATSAEAVVDQVGGGANGGDMAPAAAGKLAYTNAGMDPVWLLTGGGVLLAAGAGALWFGRRRASRQ